MSDFFSLRSSLSYTNENSSRHYIIKMILIRDEFMLAIVVIVKIVHKIVGFMVLMFDKITMPQTPVI